MIKLRLANSANSGQSDFCPPMSDYVNTLLMAANVARDLVVPPLMHKVFLVCNTANVFYWVKDKNQVGNVGAATIPVGDITNGSAPMLCPTGLTVVPGQTLSIITSRDNIIIVAIFYGQG
jgi:hypothetical protein